VEIDAKVRILRLAVAEKSAASYWALARACSDAYPVVATLAKLPAEMLVGKEMLAALRAAPDLTVRCALLKAMPRIGKDAELSVQVAAFLATQKDREVIRLAEEAIQGLRN
jgi:hypothetical protein